LPASKLLQSANGDTADGIRSKLPHPERDKSEENSSEQRNTSASIKDLELLYTRRYRTVLGISEEEAADMVRALVHRKKGLTRNFCLQDSATPW